MANPEQIQVEVVYALPDRQVVVPLALPQGATVHDAIAQSGLLKRFASIDLSRQRVGIFGKLASNDTLLSNGDRVEIYRPLIRDPKQARRELAKAGKTMGRSDKD